MIEEYELIDFVRAYRKPQQLYEEYGVFTQALCGQFYGRVSSDDVPTLLDRCKHLGLLYRMKNGNIRFL